MPARDQCVALWMGNNDLGEYRPYNATSEKIKQIPTTFSTCENNIIRVSGLSTNCLRTTEKTGEYTPFHKEREVENRLPVAFEVAAHDLVIGDKSTFTIEEIKALTNLAAANYTHESDGSDLGQWRVPNQRELALMMVYVGGEKMPNNFKSNSFYAAGTFYTAGLNSGLAKQKKAPFHTRRGTDGTIFMTLGDDTPYRIRPVRDVRTTAASEYDSKYNNSGVGFGVR